MWLATSLLSLFSVNSITLPHSFIRTPFESNGARNVWRASATEHEYIWRRTKYAARCCIWPERVKRKKKHCYTLTLLSIRMGKCFLNHLNVINCNCLNCINRALKASMPIIVKQSLFFHFINFFFRKMNKIDFRTCTHDYKIWIEFAKVPPALASLSVQLLLQTVPAEHRPASYPKIRNAIWMQMKAHTNVAFRLDLA